MASLLTIPTSTTVARPADGPTEVTDLHRRSNRTPGRPRLEYPDTEARYPGGARASNANPALEAATGWPRHEVAGRNAASLRRHLEDSGHPAWTALRAGRGWHGTFSLLRPDGDVLAHKVRVRPFSVHGGPATHFICAGRPQQPASRHCVHIP